MEHATRAVLRLARTVLEELDVEVVLGRVLEAARELTDARYAALGVLDESRIRLGRFLTLGIDEPTRRLIGPLPTGSGVLGELIRDPEPLRIADVGSHPYSYGFPVGHPPMRSFLGVPIVINGHPYGNLYLTEKQNAREFSEEDQEVVTALAGFAAVAIDHAQRFASSETQRIELQQNIDALDATLQIVRALGGQTDLASTLELVAKRGRALVSARAVVIELLRGNELELAAAAGQVPPDLVGRRVPLENTVARAALRARQTQRLSDDLNRTRFEQHGLGHVGMNAEEALIVPLVFHDRPYGVLVAVDHLDDGPFTVQHERLLDAFASSAATAVATAQSATDERLRQRVAAAEAERGRWARELHDETLQALGSLRLMLSGARRAGSAETMTEVIGKSLEQLDTDITTLRSMITELRPAALDQLGLEPAVLALLDRVRAGGLAVDARVDLNYEHGTAGERLTADVETAAYRILQEALTNVSKHGAATQVAVELVEDDSRLSITVSDDGVGFDPAIRPEGFGLAGMSERVELLGGRLSIESATGQGTTVRALLPILVRSGQMNETVSPGPQQLTG